MGNMDMTDEDVLARLKPMSGQPARFDGDQSLPLAERQRQGRTMIRRILDRSTRDQVKSGFQKRNIKAQARAAAAAAEEAEG